VSERGGGEYEITLPESWRWDAASGPNREWNGGHIVKKGDNDFLENMYRPFGRWGTYAGSVKKGGPGGGEVTGGGLVPAEQSRDLRLKTRGKFCERTRRC